MPKVVRPSKSPKAASSTDDGTEAELAKNLEGEDDNIHQED